MTVSTSAKTSDAENAAFRIQQPGLWYLIGGERLQAAPTMCDACPRQTWKQDRELSIESFLMRDRRSGSFGFKLQIRAAIRVLLREQTVRLVALSAAAKQQSKSTIRFEDLSPPGHSCPETSLARSLVQRLRHENLPTLGSQRSCKIRNELRNKRIG